MKTKPTIKPKRKAKGVPETTDSDLLNTLSKNTQDVEQKEKVYCGACKYVSESYGGEPKSHQCNHPSSLKQWVVDTPISKQLHVSKLFCYNKNANNDCSDFERRQLKPPPPPPVAPMPFPPIQQKKSRWERFLDWGTARGWFYVIGIKD